MTVPVRSDPTTVRVALDARSYDIVIGRGLLASLGTRIAAQSAAGADRSSRASRALPKAWPSPEGSQKHCPQFAPAAANQLQCGSEIGGEF